MSLPGWEEPVSVTARETKTDTVKFAEVDETILWSMDFPSGTVANCSTTYKFNGLNSFTAYGDKGKFGMSPAYGYGGNKGFAGTSRSSNLKSISLPLRWTTFDGHQGRWRFGCVGRRRSP